MHAGIPSGGKHHRDMHLDLARTRTIAAELPGVHIHEADILLLHEALAAKRRRTENEVLPHANRKVAAVSVGQAARLDSPAHLAHSLFNFADGGRIKELVELPARLGLWTAPPIVRTIHERRIDIKFLVHFHLSSLS